MICSSRGGTPFDSSLRRRDWCLLQMLRHHLHRRVAVEDLLAREQVVGDASERVEVGASIDRVAQHHLGRHVAGRADDEPRLGRQRLLQAAIGDGLHQAEVEDLDEVVAPGRAVRHGCWRA